MTPSEHDPETVLLSTDEAAERLRIKPRTLLSWFKRGELSFVRIGKHLFVTEAEVARWIKEHTERREPQA